MKQLYFLKNNIEECERENFKKNLILDNIFRGRIFAIVMIALELIFVAANISTSLLKVDNRFLFNEYLLMYLILILVNILYLLFITRVKNLDAAPNVQFKKLENIMVFYITLIMSWGSFMSLMDQKLYGHLVVFMINMITCSVMYFLDNKKILIPYFFSILIISIGLPFFQSSKDILIGHYVNLFVFVFISWLASRTIYLSYCNDYTNKALMNKAKAMLEKEIQENKDINSRLAIANLQLKNLALIDELTGISNRRGFRNYIDIAFESYVNEDSIISVMIIDIDFFKQYNDNYGHEDGDRALILLASHINSTIRSPKEFFSRWGGDEFIYVVFNSSKEEVGNLAEIIRQKVHDLKIPHEFSETYDNISVSIGTYSTKITGKQDVSKGIEFADKALYLAKNSGRNCVKNLDADN